MSKIIDKLRDTYLTNPAAALNMIPEICKAIDDGLIIELPCNKKKRAVNFRSPSLLILTSKCNY